VGRINGCGDLQMRTQKQLVFYRSILEALQELLPSSLSHSANQIPEEDIC
jgi:hypothetical protein